MSDSRSEIEEIKLRAGIVDIISEYVILKKAGRNFVGLCPFHDEKTPSFSVNPEKQIFYCFGCGKGGDVFAFIRDINNMTFPEALSHLAEKTGVTLRERRLQLDGPERKLREDLKKINRLAEDHFAENLMSDAGKSAREYLRRRGMHAATVKEFRLGLALNGWRNLRDRFEKEKIPLSLAEKAGLIVHGEKGDFYDRFRGRLIFPIENVAGEAVAFGGRGLGDEKPKYLNSPESPVYTKGKNLYGLNKAKDEIRKKGYAILVEGYFDVLSLWNAGIKNAVAALGTALTREHLDLMKRFSTEIVAIFDADEGGRSALERSIILFLEAKFHARIVILPDNLDPDDYIKKHGPKDLENLIANSESLVDYYIENVIGAKRGFEEDLQAVRKAIPFISRIADPVQRSLFIKRVAEKLNVEQALLKSEIMKTSPGPKPAAESVKKPPLKAPHALPDPVEMTLVRLIAEFPEKVHSGLGEEIFDYFQNPELRKLGLDLVRHVREKKEFSLTDLLNELEHEALRDRFLRWLVSETPFDADMIDQLFADTIDKIKQKWSKAKYKNLRLELRKAQDRGDADLTNRLAAELNRILIRKNNVH